MVRREDRETLAARLIDEEDRFTLSELCRSCAVSAELVMEMVDQGLLDVRPGRGGEWRFTGTSVRRVRVALRLHEDLGVNLAGAAMAVDLLEEVQRLRARVRVLERFGPGRGRRD